MAAAVDSHSAPRLAVINGLRGFAILGVLYFHLLTQHLTPGLEDAGLPVGAYLASPYTFFENGWLGVNLFFVLSGFVLALPYTLGQRDVRSARDVLSFYVRRARRLLPLYYLCLAVALLFETRFDVDLRRYLEEALSVATFTFVFSGRHFFVHCNAVLWSLGVEFWFSVAFPLLLIAFRRIGALPVTLAVGAVAFVVRYHPATLWNGEPTFLLPAANGPFGRLDDFVVGMAICGVYVRRPLASRATSTCAFVAGAALLTFASLAWDNVLAARLPFVVSAELNDVLLVGFALLLLGLLGGVPRAIRFVFTLAPVQLAGAMCYSLYLWHLLGMHPFEDPTMSLRYTVVRLVLIFLVSALTYRFVEFPRKSARELFLGFSG